MMYARTLSCPEKQTLLTWIFLRGWYPTSNTSAPPPRVYARMQKRWTNMNAEWHRGRIDVTANLKMVHTLVVRLQLQSWWVSIHVALKVELISTCRVVMKQSWWRSIALKGELISTCRVVLVWEIQYEWIKSIKTRIEMVTKPIQL